MEGSARCLDPTFEPGLTDPSPPFLEEAGLAEVGRLASPPMAAEAGPTNPGPVFRSITGASILIGIGSPLVRRASSTRIGLQVGLKKMIAVVEKREVDMHGQRV